MDEEVPALLPYQPHRLHAVGGVWNDGEREGTFERGEERPSKFGLATAGRAGNETMRDIG